ALAAPEHYLHDHIWNHIIKKHILRVFLWTLGALLFVDLGLQAWHLESFVHQNMIWILVVAALVGMIPESGPHLVFVMMYAKGMIPFSVLLTTSFIQDGHGMLPMLSYSLKDSVLIKIFNLVFGLGIGSILFMLGF
ncbi:MAG TPA: selenocysteine protein, partial [Desulfobacteraceae bacterium]|nr:selenocysteine protein [Desulfobacteraceae bacterium]